MLYNPVILHGAHSPPFALETGNAPTRQTNKAMDVRLIVTPPGSFKRGKFFLYAKRLKTCPLCPSSLPRIACLATSISPHSFSPRCICSIESGLPVRTIDERNPTPRNKSDKGNTCELVS